SRKSVIRIITSMRLRPRVEDVHMANMACLYVATRFGLVGEYALDRFDSAASCPGADRFQRVVVRHRRAAIRVVHSARGLPRIEPAANKFDRFQTPHSYQANESPEEVACHRLTRAPVASLSPR